MIRRALQLFFASSLALSGFAADERGLKIGSTHRLTFEDVDGDELSTANGHVSIITVVTRENEEQARAVADLVPDRYVGDAKYRYITLVNFQGKLPGLVQGITRAVIRSRLEDEAKRLRPDYASRKLAHDPRDDLFVIADFDGSAVRKLGLSLETNEVEVFVFDGEGKLVARWQGAPPGDSLANTLKKLE